MRILVNKFSESDVLRMIRESTDMTQTEFANKINKSLSVVRSYEQGQRMYDMRTFMLMAKTFGFDIILEKKNESIKNNVH